MAEPNDEITTRRQRLEHIRARDIDPYPSTVRRTHTIAEVIENFERILEQKETVTIAGRILSLRPHGGSTFANISDGTGTIQLYVKADEIGEDSYQKLEDIDIADFVSCVGNLFLTKRGEKTLLLNAAPTVISKALRPLPEKWHGLSDIEQRYRKRYLDLIANPKAKEIVYLRAKLLRELRTFLDGKGYLEVDTPILQSIPGGANARPFVTHHNTLNVDLYLRIAPELYLKQLLVGGIPKVYEIARCFRNEGMDPTHNPEFTQIEMYAAYENYEDYMRMVEELLSAVVPAICGSLIVSVDGQSIDFTPPYKRVDWNETLNAALGEKTQNLSDDNLRKLLKKKGVDAEPSDGRG
ncbi:lysine--tRNA ligase, partial [Candidatus Uhrbacteria bacterium CG10_big_fil_rev_8_21_14_0_10_48_11]